MVRPMVLKEKLMQKEDIIEHLRLFTVACYSEIVDKPDSFVVTAFEHLDVTGKYPSIIVVQAYVNNQMTFSQMLGKGGKNTQSVRNIIKAIGARLKVKVYLNIEMSKTDV